MVFQNFGSVFYTHLLQIRRIFQTNLIMNLQKDDSTYAIGMKPFVYSIKKNKQDNTHEWSRGGFDVKYYKNTLKTKDRECAVSDPSEP